MIWILAGAAVLAAVPSGLRWLRVAQREHYLAPSVSRFAARWWFNGPINGGLFAVSLAGVVGAWMDARWGLLVVAAQVGPVGLSLRGRTSPLAWTPRLRRVAALAGVMLLGGTVGGAAAGLPVVVALALFALPMLVDLALVLLGPVEDRLGAVWVEKAARRLEGSGARVVAITGSYGKTTTKEYVRHLLSGARVVASPASFNNRMGLARAINEHLVPGTEVFVAEMGTYGPGEIAALCEWIRPEVAAMVSIGPVHLERFRSEERIVAAKSEILDRARVGVIAVDHPLLAALAAERADSMEVVTASAGGANADVTVEDGRLVVAGEAVGEVPDGVFGVNLAVAAAVVVALGHRVDPDLIPTLPRAEHRQSQTIAPGGFTIIDDTFNSNPAGATRALATLAAFEGRKVVVTPGMVELGPVQGRENEAFASAASEVADRVVVVGRTNRTALLRGAATGRASVTVVANRGEAVDLVRAELGAGDAVLYENDLPDHYP